MATDTAPAGAQEIPAPQTPDDVRDILRGPAAVSVKIGKGDLTQEYIQKPLSFMAIMDWFALVGEAIDNAMSGDNPLSVSGLFAVPEGARGGVIRPEDFEDADTFVKAIGKLVRFAPHFIERSFCIWLGVPDYREEIAINIMKQSPDDGGIGREQFVQVITTFLEQNRDEVQKFVREDLGKLRGLLTEEAKTKEA